MKKYILIIIAVIISGSSCKLYQPKDFNNKNYDFHDHLLKSSIQFYNDSLFLYIDDLRISEGLWEIHDEKFIILKSFPRKTKGYYCYKFYNEEVKRYEPYQYIEFTKKVKIVNSKLLKADSHKYYLTEKTPKPISNDF